MGPNKNRDINDINQWADEPVIGSNMKFIGHEVAGQDSYNYNWEIEFKNVENQLPLYANYHWQCTFIQTYNDILDTLDISYLYTVHLWENEYSRQYIYAGDYLVDDCILFTPVEEGTDIWGTWNKYKIKDTDCSYNTPAGHFDGLVRMDIMVYSELIGTLYYSPQLSHIVYFSLDASQFGSWKKYFELTEVNYN